MSPGMSPLAMPQNRQSATVPVTSPQSSGQNARTVPASTLRGTFLSQAPAQGPHTHSPVVGS